MEGKPIRASYRWTGDEYEASHRLYMRHGASVAIRVFVAIFSVLALFLALLEFLSGRPVFGALYVLLVLVLLLGRAPIQVWLVHRRHRLRPDADRDLTFQFDEKGITSETDESTSSITWNLVFRAVATPTGALLFLTARQYWWLPSHAFESEAEYARFRELLGRSTNFKAA